MLEEDHKVEESCAVENNKEAFSVSLGILALEFCRYVFPIPCQLGSVEAMMWQRPVPSGGHTFFH